jgi:hypothetical protein
MMAHAVVFVSHYYIRLSYLFILVAHGQQISHPIGDNAGGLGEGRRPPEQYIDGNGMVVSKYHPGLELHQLLYIPRAWTSKVAEKRAEQVPNQKTLTLDF